MLGTLSTSSPRRSSASWAREAGFRQSVVDVLDRCAAARGTGSETVDRFRGPYDRADAAAGLQPLERTERSDGRRHRYGKGPQHGSVADRVCPRDFELVIGESPRSPGFHECLRASLSSLPERTCLVRLEDVAVE